MLPLSLDHWMARVTPAPRVGPVAELTRGCKEAAMRIDIYLNAELIQDDRQLAILIEMRVGYRSDLCKDLN